MTETTINCTLNMYMPGNGCIWVNKCYLDIETTRDEQK